MASNRILGLGEHEFVTTLYKPLSLVIRFKEHLNARMKQKYVIGTETF
jgi:hypothetical protein